MSGGHIGSISTGFQDYKRTYSPACACGWHPKTRWYFHESAAKAQLTAHLKAVGVRNDRPLTVEEIMAEDAQVVRVDGQAKCIICSRPYTEHTRCEADDFGTFARGCDGRILKL